MKNAYLETRPARRNKVQPSKNQPAPTEAQFAALQGLFDFFNKALFKNELPQCILNLSRISKKYEGFFAPDRWANRTEAENGILAEGAKTYHEISLCPEYISQKPEWVMSVLVHEMAHLQREVTGEKPSRKNYHDQKWADMMLAVGLTPISITNPGKMTGQNCSHSIDPDGRFAKSFALLPIELLLPFAHISQPDKEKKKKTSNKVKFTCPQCEANAWGKPDLNVLCGECDDEFTGRPQKMLFEGEREANEAQRERYLDGDDDQDDE